MKVQTPLEEKWNWITHGFGFVLSLVGVFLLFRYDVNKTQYSSFAIGLYGGSLLLLYFASTAYHYTVNSQRKKKFRVLDHVSIYLLIAGTYSPVTLITLLDSKGVLLFFLVWSLAILGSVLKLFFIGKFQILSIVLYLIMGWLIVFDMDSLIVVLEENGINYLMYGGLAYTIGIIFYGIKTIPYGHVIWHIFVLLGSIFHFMFVIKCIV